MQKIILKITLLFAFVAVVFSLTAQTIYYEDFRYATEVRGFTVQHVALDGQSADEVGKRVSDVVDASDSSPVFEESSRPANGIPSGVARDQRTISLSNTSEPTVGNFENHEIEAWALITNQDLSAVNLPKVSFWTQQRFVFGGGATISVWVSENYTHGAGGTNFTDSPPSAATWTNETANIVGAIATSDMSPQTYVRGELDLSDYTGASVTIAFKVVTDDTAYETGINQHGIFYVSDVKFEGTAADAEDVANGAFSALNTSSSGQTNVFNTPSASISQANFSNMSAWTNIFTTETSVPRLANGVLIPTNEGYKFEISSAYNPTIVTELRIKLANGTANNGAPDESRWKVQGSNDDSTWDDLCTPFGMFSGNTVPNIGTVALTTAQAYRYYRIVLATVWTPNQNFTALQEIDFTIGDVPVVTTEDVANGVFSALNTSASGQTNVFNTPSVSIDAANFSNTGAWANIFTTETSVPRLANGALIPTDEGYKFEIGNAYNPAVVTEVRIKLANGTANNGAPDESRWIVQGSNDNSAWDDLCTQFGMFSGNSVPNIGTIALTTTQAYRYYRIVLAADWTPNQNFTALQEIDFTIGDIPVVTTEDVADGVFSALNTSSSGQTNVFNTPSASINDVNFSNTGTWANIFTTETSVPRLANGALIPTNEGYKFEVGSAYNPTSVVEVRIKLANGTANNGAPDESRWIVQGSNDDSAWDDLCTQFGMFSGNSIPNIGTIALTTTQAYRYYRIVLAADWTPNQNFTALQEIDFTIGELVSTDDEGLSSRISIYPNPVSDILNISVLDANIDIKNTTVINLTGKVVYKGSFSNIVDVSSFSTGIYLLRLETEEGKILTKKLVVN